MTQAVADRDHVADQLHQAVYRLRMALGGRSIGAPREAPYVCVFPQGAEHYTACRLGQRRQRFENLLELLADWLAVDDPVRIEAEASIRSGLDAWLEAESAVIRARSALALGRVERDGQVAGWRRALEQAYGQLVYRVGKRAAERFFPKAPRKGRDPAPDVPPTPTRASQDPGPTSGGDGPPPSSGGHADCSQPAAGGPMRTAWMMLPLAGCFGVGWVPVSYVNEGQVCFWQEGNDLAVSVRAPECLSSTCSRDFAGSCSATLEDDGTITLSSKLEWEDDQSPTASCTDDCGAPMATCLLQGLPDGTYAVHFGEEELEVVFPTPEPCEPM